MSPDKMTLLEYLGGIDGGVPFKKGSKSRRLAGHLMKDGLVECLGVGDIKIYMITDKGKKVLENGIQP